MTLTLTDFATPTLPVKSIRSLGNVRADLGALDELARSIKETGLHQPIEVALDGDVAYVIDGHRRLAAVNKLRWTDIPVTVATDLEGMKPEEQRIAVQLVANMQRVDLTALEEAAGYAQLKSFGWKQNQIARRVGRSQAHVSKRLALLDLPDEAIELAEAGRLGPEALYSLSQAAVAGGDVEGIVSTLTENHELDDEPIQLEEVEHMTREAITDAKGQEELSARKIEYEERGIAVKVVEARSGYPPELPKDRIGYTFDVDHDTHLTEPCALICLFIRWGSVHESQHCTDRRRHTPDGASKLKLPAPKQTPKAKDQAAARRRSKALTAAAEAAMESRQPARDKVIDRMAVLYLDRIDANAHKKAARLLNMEAEIGDDYKGLSDLYDNADSNWRSRILLAAVIAHGHQMSAWDDEGHLAFLADIGQAVDPEALT